MEWYPFYFQLYKSDTMHLSPYDDGCYRRLIDYYMESRSPLPDNDHALARIIGDSLANGVANSLAIIRPFFKAKNGLLFHKRCDAILEEQDRRAKKLSENGKKGAEKRHNKNNDLPSGAKAEPIAPPKPAPSTRQDNTIQDNKLVITSEDNKQTLEIINKKTLQKKIFEKPENVSEQIWQDFLAHRKAKKAPVTETVINRFAQEAEKIGWTLEQALVESCAQNWQGFKAEWVKNSQNRGIGGQQNVPKTRLTRSQQFDRATDEIFNEIDRGLVGQ